MAQEVHSQLKQRTAYLLLDVAAMLMAAGAHTQRVERNLQRTAVALGFKVEAFFSLSGITLSLQDPGHLPITVFKKITSYGVQLSIVSAISRLSWNTSEANGKPLAEMLDEIELELQRISAIPHYPKLLVIFMIAVAGMAFCRVAGGDMLSVVLTGIASATGFVCRNHLLGKQHNLAVAWASASFVASLIAGAGTQLLVMAGFSLAHSEIAVATSVLFLVPGVPMINSITDLMHGHMSLGLGRAMQGTVISFSIALGIIFSHALLSALGA
ncbi:threonine/serine exporter family protein [Pelagibaculum spongiae]|uniref:Threonine/serine exporter-like N-terminal domain-containing protein n=1 Tax=Pelagibaculum spongiae TaxID=2080658 RepID=A0A2V1GXF0_9GAMM|nr:threonine/serine exporter family protein [Pelagibaculum spongiae]PVZ68944.1 hypothetical protein DC094_11905 [Pelagibaculum spongiae]